MHVVSVANIPTKIGGDMDNISSPVISLHQLSSKRGLRVDKNKNDGMNKYCARVCCGWFQQVYKRAEKIHIVHAPIIFVIR